MEQLCGASNTVYLTPTDPDMRHAAPQTSTLLVKRASCGGDDREASQRGLPLASAFPTPVWVVGLLPLLTLRDAVMLRTACRAMRAIVADMPAGLGELPLKRLKEMMTCFPKADSVWLEEDGEDPMSEAEQDSLIAWLKERGTSLTDVNGDTEVEPFLRRAWRAGLFKAVKRVSLSLYEEEDRNLIIDGIVGGVKSIDVYFSNEAPQIERALLAFLRTFPALKCIFCCMLGSDDTALPPFIPPSLERLELDCSECSQPLQLLGCLPPMIESSGASPHGLKLTLVTLPDEDTATSLLQEDTARGVRSLLQACGSTLTEVELVVQSELDSAAEVLEGLAGCPHLDRLKAPIGTFAVTPPGLNPTFSIVRLVLTCCPGDQKAFSPTLWGLMARGAFPNLMSLEMGSRDLDWEFVCVPALVAAFEGIARTLKELTLSQGPYRRLVGSVNVEGPLRQLGEDIGKLRRLETLHIDIDRQGLEYRWIAQGMAKGSCPALRSLTFAISRGAAWLACQPSIILPSVQSLRVLFDGAFDGGEALALALSLTSLRYRGFVVVTNVSCGQGQRDEVRRLLKPLVSGVRFGEKCLVRA
jgi:hypothetical protein